MNTGLIRKRLGQLSKRLHHSFDADPRLEGIAERLVAIEEVVGDMQAENRTHEKIIKANGQAVKKAKALNAATVGAHGGDPDDPVEKVRSAATKLDNGDDAHWTKKGQPDLNVLSEYAGIKVDRKLADAALEGIVRQ